MFAWKQNSETIKFLVGPKIMRPISQQFITILTYFFFWEATERPREGLGAIVGFPGEQYLSTTFHYFRAKHFSSFRDFASLVFDIVTTPGSFTLQKC